MRNASYSSQKFLSSAGNSLSPFDNFLKTIPCVIKDIEYEYDGLGIVDPQEKFRTCSLDYLKPSTNVVNPGEFLKIAALQLENFKHFPQITSKFPTLTLIKIINSNFHDIPQICTARLKIILLHNVTADRLDLNGCNRLTYFAHESSDLARVDVNAFHDLTQLSHLSLKGNKIERLPEGIFASLKRLAFLQLAENQLKTIDGDLIAKNYDLLFIDLSNNPIETIGSEFFENNEVKIINMNKVKCYSNKIGMPMNWEKERHNIMQKCHDKLTMSSRKQLRGITFGIILFFIAIGAAFGYKRIQENKKRQREIQNYNNFL